MLTVDNGCIVILLIFHTSWTNKWKKLFVKHIWEISKKHLFVMMPWLTHFLVLNHEVNFYEQDYIIIKVILLHVLTTCINFKQVLERVIIKFENCFLIHSLSISKYASVMSGKYISTLGQGTHVRVIQEREHVKFIHAHGALEWIDECSPGHVYVGHHRDFRLQRHAFLLV